MRTQRLAAVCGQPLPARPRRVLLGKCGAQPRQMQHGLLVAPQHDGALDHFFDDELVPASKGVPAELLRKIESFPTTSDLKPYQPGFLAGWVVEQYQIDLIAAAQHSREIMEGKTRQMCAGEVPGDTHRNLDVDSDFSAQTFKHVLVPIWLLSYLYGTKTYQVSSVPIDQACWRPWVRPKYCRVLKRVSCSRYWPNELGTAAG